MEVFVERKTAMESYMRPIYLLLTMLLIAPTSAPAAESLDGTTIEIGESAERPTLLKFWATWCVACLEEMPAYTALFEKYGDDVQFLAVNVAINDPLERVISTIAEYELAAPVAYDDSGALWSRFGVLGTPAYVLLGRDGAELYRAYGHNEGLAGALDDALVRRDTVETDNNAADAASNQSRRIVRDIDGNTVDLTPDAGEVIVAYHFAIWCASYVEDSFPELSARCHSFDERIRQLRALDLPGVRMIGFVSAYSTQESSAFQYQESRGIDHALVFDADGAYSSTFGTRDFPHVSIIGEDGAILFTGNQMPHNTHRIIESHLRSEP